MHPPSLCCLVLSTLGLLSAACSPRDKSTEAVPTGHAAGENPSRPAPDTVAADQTPPAPAQADTGRSAPATPVLTATATTTTINTAEATEALSEKVKLQLGLLAKALESPVAATSDLTAFCTESVNVTDTSGWVPTIRHEGPPVTVAETTPAGGAVATTSRTDPASFLQRMREVLSLETPSGIGAASFKLFGLERNGDQLRTRQRLTARGSRGPNEVRSLIVADATWRVATGDAPPRLTGFTWSKATRAEQAATATTRFEDTAGRLLGGTEAWAAQLRIGMNTWARRLDRSLKPDFLGYHGVAIGDVNGDDLEDVYLCQPGGLPNLLFQQQPDGTLTDVSAAAGVDWLDNSTGALLVDLDNDGDADLAVATQRAFLLMENDGSGRFSTRVRLNDLGLGYSPTASDFDLDGDLDLLVLRYGADSREIGGFPTPHPFYDARNGGANVLLENRGDFQFADVTEARGMGAGNFRFSFAASWEDYDNDGDPDVYVANDFGPNQLLRNDRGRFIDVSVESRAQDWGFGMSATWGDADRDGFMDLYVSNMFSGAGNQIVPQADFNPSMNDETRGKYLKMVRGNSLLRNGGDGKFTDVTDPMAEGFGKWAWGAKFADLDNDGWEDLYVANGYISQPDKDDL
jgi:hypothetical protein